MHKMDALRRSNDTSPEAQNDELERNSLFLINPENFMGVAKFQKSFDKALEQGYFFYRQFLEDRSAFVAASPLFNDPFADDFLQLLKSADNLETLDDNRGHQFVLTARVNEEMEKCRVHYRNLMMYIRLGFDSPEVVSEVFGKNSFFRAKSSALYLVALMRDAHSMAENAEYKQVLLDTGFLQADIDLLNSLGDDLNAALQARDEYVLHSVTRKNERYDAFERFWEQMILISQFSKIIFRDNPAYLSMYMLHPEKARKAKRKRKEIPEESE